MAFKLRKIIYKRTHICVAFFQTAQIYDYSFFTVYHLSNLTCSTVQPLKLNEKVVFVIIILDFLHCFQQMLVLTKFTVPYC
jgi:hypothetical protein